MFDVSDVEFIERSDGTLAPLWTMLCKNTDDLIGGESKLCFEKFLTIQR